MLIGVNTRNLMLSNELLRLRAVSKYGGNG